METGCGADGTIAFDPILFKNEDVGKTYTFRVTEVQGHDDSILYDNTAYVVKVTPKRGSDNGDFTGTLTFDIVVMKVASTGPGAGSAPETQSSGSFSAAAAISPDEIVFENITRGTTGKPPGHVSPQTGDDDSSAGALVLLSLSLAAASAAAGGMRRKRQKR